VAFFLFHDIDGDPVTPARPLVVVTGRTLGQALRDWRF